MVALFCVAFYGAFDMKNISEIGNILHSKNLRISKKIGKSLYITKSRFGAEGEI